MNKTIYCLFLLTTLSAFSLENPKARTFELNNITIHNSIMILSKTKLEIINKSIFAYMMRYFYKPFYGVKNTRWLILQEHNRQLDIIENGIQQQHPQIREWIQQPRPRMRPRENYGHQSLHQRLKTAKNILGSMDHF